MLTIDATDETALAICDIGECGWRFLTWTKDKAADAWLRHYRYAHSEIPKVGPNAHVSHIEYGRTAKRFVYFTCAEPTCNERVAKAGNRCRTCSAAARTVNRLCTVDGCTRKHFARGLCNAHYQRQNRRPAQPREFKPRATCPQCGKEVWKPVKTECLTCKRANKAAAVCAVDGCTRPAFARGMCSMHYAREWRRK